MSRVSKVGIKTLGGSRPDDQQPVSCFTPRPADDNRGGRGLPRPVWRGRSWCLTWLREYGGAVWPCGNCTSLAGLRAGVRPGPGRGPGPAGRRDRNPGRHPVFPAERPELATVGQVLVVAGDEQALAPCRATQATLIVDDLEECRLLLSRAGAQVLRGPAGVGRPYPHRQAAGRDPDRVRAVGPGPAGSRRREQMMKFRAYVEPAEPHEGLEVPPEVVQALGGASGRG